MLEIILPNGQTRQVEEGSTLLPLAEELALNYNSPLVEGVVNGRAIDLQRPLQESGPIDFIEVNTEEGMRVYIRTLIFMLEVAAKKVHPGAQLEVTNTLGSALHVIDNSPVPIKENELAEIEAEMKAMVAAKEPIILKNMPKEEALAKYAGSCSDDTLALLEEIPAGTMMSLYFLRNQLGYYFGHLCPNAGYVPYFELLPYEDGLIINYPDTGKWDLLPPFDDRRKLQSAYKELEQWAAKIGCNTIGRLNKAIAENRSDKIIQISEAFHERKLIAIADQVVARGEQMKLIFIAGPSSSGKTSTAQRLSIHLAVHGIETIPVSMDDYYLNREDSPRKPDGSYDFECLEAIDLALFDDQITRLLAGETVELPKYNFKTGLREYNGRRIKMQPNTMLIIEGIHGLNERLTANLPPESLMKIYVSALTPMSLDPMNRINTTDVRLMRRMVRDNQFRSHDALATLERWESVRYGEENYIFPFQGSADVIFNTTLIYELAALKKYAEPLLEAVPQSAGHAYITARRLLNLLSYIKPIEEEAIPNSSIMREFIGGSIFKEAL